MTREFSRYSVGGECLAQNLFRGTVVWGCVKSADASAKGAVDDGGGGEGVGIVVVLGVEGSGAENERSKNSRGRWSSHFAIIFIVLKS